MNTLQQEPGDIKQQVTKDGEMGFFSRATAMFIINKYPQYSLQSFLSEISIYKNLRNEFFDCMDKQLATALEEQKKKVEVIVKKYAEAEEVIINGQRFLIVDGVEKEFGYPFPDTREKYILKELALLKGKDTNAE